ncbi:MAG: hypothetical protein OXI01_11105 [Albidovulum sp.]|nr:hypothetical protein [Albidovulum sp.]
MPRTAILLAVVLAGSGASAYFAWRDAEMPPSGLPRVPFLDSTPGGERQRESDRYRETLQTANEINANAAEEKGDSFISTPEATLEELAAVPAKEHAPWNRGLPGKPALGQSKPEPGKGPGRHLGINAAGSRERPASVGAEDPVEVEDSPYPDLFPGRMNALAGAMSIAAPAGRELKTPDSRPFDAEVSEKIPGSVESIGAEATDALKIPAGEMLYAETPAAVDSRRQAPAAAVVAQGPLAESRPVGGLSTHSGARGLYPGPAASPARRANSAKSTPSRSTGLQRPRRSQATSATRRRRARRRTGGDVRSGPGKARVATRPFRHRNRREPGDRLRQARHSREPVRRDRRRSRQDRNRTGFDGELETGDLARGGAFDRRIASVASGTGASEPGGI